MRCQPTNTSQHNRNCNIIKELNLMLFDLILDVVLKPSVIRQILHQQVGWNKLDLPAWFCCILITIKEYSHAWHILAYPNYCFAYVVYPIFGRCYKHLSALTGFHSVTIASSKAIFPNFPVQFITWLTIPYDRLQLITAECNISPQYKEIQSHNFIFTTFLESRMYL